MRDENRLLYLIEKIGNLRKQNLNSSGIENAAIECFSIKHKSDRKIKIKTLIGGRSGFTHILQRERKSLSRKFKTKITFFAIK